MWVRMSGAGRVGAVLVAAVLVLTGGASAVAGERDPEGPPVAASAAPVGLSPAPAADGVPRPGGGDPSGAPPAEAGVGTLAAGATTLTFDEDARQARLRVDDGGTLDQYLYGPGPITFDIDLNGLDPTPAGGQPVELRLFTYDVDQAGSEECGPEVDRVLANGRPIGTLTGANEQWIVNTFSIPPGTLQRDVNSFRIDIDTAGTGCWGVRVDWVGSPGTELEFAL